MGMLRSKTYLNVTVNDVALGVPREARADGTAPQPGDTADVLWFVWHDEAFPNGIVHADASVTVDEEE
jgi:hypothetical protein